MENTRLSLIKKIICKIPSLVRYNKAQQINSKIRRSNEPRQEKAPWQVWALGSWPTPEQKRERIIFSAQLPATKSEWRTSAPTSGAHIHVRLMWTGTKTAGKYKNIGWEKNQGSHNSNSADSHGILDAGCLLIVTVLRTYYWSVYSWKKVVPDGLALT